MQIPGFYRFASLVLALILPNQAAFGSSDGKGVYEGPKASNCGLNCTLAALVRFNREIDVNAIISDLKLDPGTTNPTSFFEIRTALQKRSLLVEGLKGVALPDLLVKLDDANISIVEVSSEEGPNHFLCVYKCRKDGKIELLDYPNPPVQVNIADFGYSLLSKFTGNILIVSNKEKPERATSLIESSQNRTATLDAVADNAHKEESNGYVSGHSLRLPKVLDIGEVSENSDVSVVNLSVHNFTASIVKDIKITGECTCFEGFEGPRSLDGESQGLYRVKFNRKILLSTATRGGSSIVLQSSDRSLPAAKIKIMGVPAPRSKVAFFSPAVVSAMPMRSKEGESVQNTKLYLPEDWNESFSVRFSDSDAREFEISQGAAYTERIFEKSRRVIPISVKLRQNNVGTSDRIIYAMTDDPLNAMIALEIRGLLE